MIVVTTNEVAGKRIVKTLGLVRGNTVRARHLGHDVLAFLRNLVGGEIYEYTKMVAESREHAIDRLVADAKSIGANAVIGIQFSTAYVGSNMAEMLVYGTAVIIEDEAPHPAQGPPAH